MSARSIRMSPAIEGTHSKKVSGLGTMAHKDTHPSSPSYPTPVLSWGLETQRTHDSNFFSFLTLLLPSDPLPSLHFCMTLKSGPHNISLRVWKSLSLLFPKPTLSEGPQKDLISHSKPRYVGTPYFIRTLSNFIPKPILGRQPLHRPLSATLGNT